MSVSVTLKYTFSKCAYCFNAAKCEELGDPNDGVVMVSGLYQGAIATYECNPNYELQGTATRTCDTSAMWTNSEPSCTRKWIVNYKYKNH